METLYTPEQAAEILQVHVKTVQGWIRAGKLKAVRAGRFWRVKESDLEAYLVPASSETTPKEQAR
jgi:excisionase family DNA binding protein